MNLTIDAIEAHARGKVYTVTADEHAVSIVLTFHALGRIAQWRLTVERVLEALLWPEEVLRGHRGRFIAHYRDTRHVVRVVYEYEGSMPGAITVDYPYAERYFEGGGRHEDRVLS
jgi:hypothetical protein